MDFIESIALFYIYKNILNNNTSLFTRSISDIENILFKSSIKYNKDD